MERRTTPPHSTASIGLKNIQLFKEEILGIGSYGKVCRAKCDHLLCAAKIIHETLFDPAAAQQMSQEREHRLPIRRFEQECEFLNTIRHPNVIQYLGMYRDPDTGLPVLLMELMDDNLTHFLEASTQSIPYHVQVNICHDIALALTFLHTNGIVHRDLSSNNVLLISNVKAKVTDFGMAKFGDRNLRATRLTFTMSPGTDVYMPPEAVQDQPIYTEIIDCFSFGVIVVQVLTRQFPNPGDRLQKVELNHPGLPRGTLMVCIPEVDRRQNHISQIGPNNTLLPIALDCLKDRDVERPSAQQLCERVAALKESDAYAENVRDAQMTITQRDMQEQLLSLREEHTRAIDNLQELRAREEQSLREEHTRAIEHLQESQAREEQSLREEHTRAINNLQESRAREEQSLREEHTRAIEHLQESRAREEQSLREQHTRAIKHLLESRAKEKQSLRREHSREIQNLQEIQLREREGIIAAKEYEIKDLLQSHSEAIAARERDNQQLRLQLEQTTHKMNKKVKDLEGQLLKQMRLDLPSKDLQTQLDDSQKYADVTDMKLVWRIGKPAPQNMSRRCNAAVHTDKTMVYFNVGGQTPVYCYNISNDLWTRLPDCPNWCSSFVVINNMLTAIGGIKDGQYSNKVYSLKEGGAWVEEFPPMPTKRTSATAVCTESSLIVIGGVLDGSIRCPVEVMDIASHQWAIAANVSIKQEFQQASGVICDDQLYILGAIKSKSVYSCSLRDLLQSCQPASESTAAPPRPSNILWRELADLPLYNSTCVSLCGHLLAIGGNDCKSENTSSAKAVYAYKPTTNSWKVISQMSVARYLCFAVTLPTNNELMVVGGRSNESSNSATSSVEFANLI